MVLVAVVEAPPRNCEDSGCCSCKTKEMLLLKNGIEVVALEWQRPETVQSCNGSGYGGNGCDTGGVNLNLRVYC